MSSTPSTPLLTTPSLLMPSFRTTLSTPMPSPLSSPSTAILPFPSSPFSDALSSYQSRTNIDFSKHPLLPKLQNCDSPDRIRTVLHQQAPEFDTSCLTTTVDVLYAFSSTLGKCIGMEFAPSYAILVAIGILLEPVNHSGVSQERLIDLFRRMQTSFQRLKVYTGVPLTERLKDLIVQFMATVLSILAVFTKSINRRPSKLEAALPPPEPQDPDI
ncbi:hypothetical protein BGW80DRAFT_1258118 [Lactifluus volemus]|nr:hypothetical protein BGW80DRAFT_1258118 [Lactifluus volemus]